MRSRVFVGNQLQYTRQGDRSNKPSDLRRIIKSNSIKLYQRRLYSSVSLYRSQLCFIILVTKSILQFNKSTSIIKWINKENVIWFRFCVCTRSLVLLFLSVSLLHCFLYYDFTLLLRLLNTAIKIRKEVWDGLVLQPEFSGLPRRGFFFLCCAVKSLLLILIKSAYATFFWSFAQQLSLMSSQSHPYATSTATTTTRLNSYYP